MPWNAAEKYQNATDQYRIVVNCIEHWAKHIIGSREEKEALQWVGIGEALCKALCKAWH